MRALIGAMLLCAAAGAANAQWEGVLEGRDLTGDGIADAFYSIQQNITWLKDADYQKTSGYVKITDHDDFPHDPGLNIIDTRNFAATLDIGGITGWRFAGGTADCLLIACSPNASRLTTSETFTLETLLGGDLSMFKNVLSSYYIDLSGGTGGKYGLWGPGGQFGPGLYENEGNFKSGAWAVHDGDVGVAAPIPEPSTYALMALGLSALALATRRRRKS